MMKNELQTYLHDHLAGAALAIDLLTVLEKGHEHDELGNFFSELLAEIKADRDQLAKILHRAGGRSAGFKEMIARLLEKMMRLKFGRSIKNPLGFFEALETLALGIAGKEALWAALASLDDPRVKGFDYAELGGRAREQRERVERLRLRAAGAAFSADPPMTG